MIIGNETSNWQLMGVMAGYWYDFDGALELKNHHLWSSKVTGHHHEKTCKAARLGSTHIWIRKRPRKQFGVVLQGLVYFLMYWNDTWNSDSWGSFSFCWGVEGSLLSISLCLITSHWLNSILPFLSCSCGSMMEGSWSSSLIGTIIRQEAQESGNSYRAAACWDYGASVIWAASYHFWGVLKIGIKIGSFEPLDFHRIGWWLSSQAAHRAQCIKSPIDVNAARAATGKSDAEEVQFVVKPVPWRWQNMGNGGRVGEVKREGTTRV